MDTEPEQIPVEAVPAETEAEAETELVSAVDPGPDVVDGGTYVTTVRFSRLLADQVEVISRVLGRSQSEVVREAVGVWVAGCRSDPVFVARLRERVELDRELLEGMS